MDPTNSDFVIYADESGDHGLDSIDPEYPVFVLAFCIFRIEEYIARVVPEVQRLKFRYFGHDAVVLHSHEIRKQTGQFTLLQDPGIRAEFMNAVSEVVEAAPFTIVCSLIRKDRLKDQYRYPHNPYDLAMLFCLERAFDFIEAHSQHHATTHLVVESRGKKEDNELELAFLRHVSGENRVNRRLPFSLRFAPKSHNSTGLQLADLAAWPIGRHHLKPDQSNRAFQALEPKLVEQHSGLSGGVRRNLKVFP